jgi:PAS domain S-box-containing protein
MLLRNTSQYIPANILQDRGMREAFTAAGSRSVEFFVETMDTMWFDRSEIEPEFLSLFRKKYGSRKIDLLMAAGADALDFAQRFREVLLPGVPIVFYNVAEDAFRGGQRQPGITGVVLRFNLPGTLELAVRLQPAARRIVVVSGASPYDFNWLRRARAALQRYQDRFEVAYWTGRPLEDILTQVKTLSADTIVLYLAYSDDGAGHTYAPADIARQITEASAAPVFGVLETYLGQGVVGGAFPSFEAHGKLAGEVALRVLSGENPQNINVQPSSAAVATVDWRALKRRGISESRLPSGSVVRFRPPAIWEQYKWYIIAALAIIAVQTLLIVGLLVHRSRRRRAETQLRESQEFMELSTDAGELGLWVRDLARGEVWANPRLRTWFGLAANDALRFEDLLGAIHPNDRARVTAEVARMQQAGSSYEGEFRVVDPGGSERWVLTRGRASKEASGATGRRMGVVLDITERKQAEESSRQILEAAPNGMILVDREGIISSVNAAAEVLFGYSRGQLIGQPIEMLIPDRFRAKHLGDRQNYAAEPRLRSMGANGEIFGRRKNGSEVPVEIGLSPMRTPRGLFVLASISDVTARKQAAQDLNAAFNEIRGLKERLEEENLYLKEEISEVKGFDEIVGKSDALKYVLTRVEQVAKTDATVLLQGETGVGKELIARAIHEKSLRSTGPLIKVNCAALPDALVESELFGHEKGAFTGADRERKGRFELAAGGTILLDEVGELPLGTQAKLLRVLQDGEFERVGSSTSLKANARVIAATNRKLHEEVSAGRFRQDLFYRLNVYPITVPPLRQRREDVPSLVTHYARQLGERMGKNINEVPAQVVREFTEYNWPGNIRELLNVIERAVIVSSDGVLRLPEPLGQATTGVSVAVKTSEASTIVATSDDAERENILRALEATGWRINGPKGAAELLKLHPSTLRFRMKKLGVTKVLGYTSQADKSNLH